MPISPLDRQQLARAISQDVDRPLAVLLVNQAASSSSG